MLTRLPLFLITILSLALLSGCSSLFKTKVTTPKLLKTENAEQSQLVAEVNRFARVPSMRAKIGLKFEDNSYGENGVAELYKQADGEVVVQRPANIFLKVQAPFVKTDIAVMASDGEKFQIAILQDGGDGRFKKFIRGTNNADYSLLQEKVKNADLQGGDALKKNVNAFSNLRPQHFTDALLVRPVDTNNYAYLTSTILQEEVDMKALKDKSPTAWILHGYYLLDEFRKEADGSLKITRRFWFDRVGGIRLARQQIFDAKGEIDSDILYGLEGNLGTNDDYKSLPMQITVTRPKDKYKMRLTYSAPGNISVGKSYDRDVFNLKNDFGLEELLLDEKLREFNSTRPSTVAPTTATKNQ